MRVADVLAHKGSTVVTITPQASMAEATGLLARHRVGALVVTGDNRIIQGIISERDVVRALDEYGSALLTMTVGLVMTATVTTCIPSDEISSLARTMTERRFRHLPVVIDGLLSGIVTIGDVVKSRIDELETEHDQLVGYISSS